MYIGFPLLYIFIFLLPWRLRYVIICPLYKALSSQFLIYALSTLLFSLLSILLFTSSFVSLLSVPINFFAHSSELAFSQFLFSFVYLISTMSVFNETSDVHFSTRRFAFTSTLSYPAYANILISIETEWVSVRGHVWRAETQYLGCSAKVWRNGRYQCSFDFHWCACSKLWLRAEHEFKHI